MGREKALTIVVSSTIFVAIVASVVLGVVDFARFSCSELCAALRAVPCSAPSLRTRSTQTSNF